jgi:hypothetical protein
MIDNFKSDAAHLELMIASRRVWAACQAAEDAVAGLHRAAEAHANISFEAKADRIRGLADRLGGGSRECHEEAVRLFREAVAAFRGVGGDT